MLKINKSLVTVLLLFLASSIITCGGGGGGAAEEVMYYEDADGDGYGNRIKNIKDTSQPDGYVSNLEDCNDNDASINPDAEEIPDDGIDNNCDELYANTYYEDLDGDGYGNPDVTNIYTSQADGYVLNDTDCDDTDPDINPRAPEICGDGIDNNCDGQVDELCTIRVPEDYSNIQYAINVVLYGGIVLVNDGTYIENINFKGKPITVQSVNGAESTIIDGNEKGTVVTLRAGNPTAMVLDGFTITGGLAKMGGGIYCDESTKITNCIITGNTATGYQGRGGGGGICGSPNITNCTISGNTAYAGGGIYGSPNITNCTISDNTAFGGVEMGNGGGIHCSYANQTSLTDCTITGNSAVFAGGGIYCGKASTLTITNSTISGNSATGGGGISVGSYSTATITNSTISDNSANVGAGIESYRSTVTITDTTISNSIGAGILDSEKSTLTVSNSTVSNNSSGIWINGSTLTISNSTVSNRGVGIACMDISSLATVVNSIIWGNGISGADEISLCGDSSLNITYSDVRDGWEGEGNIDADPLFVDDTSEDISLRDYHLTADSPCIDAGTDTYIVDEENIVPAYDIDGDERPQGEGIDMGSDEYK